MRKYIPLAIIVLSGALTLSAQVQPAASGIHPLEVTLSYSALRANAPPGRCTCFWMQGGSADFHVELVQRIGVVGDVSGHHDGSINSAHQQLGLVSYLFGLRYTQVTRARLAPFAQALVGPVHGFDALFPNAGGSSITPNAAAASFGGGLNVNVSRHFALRALQADYVLTTLPNNAGNRQNNFRLGAGRGASPPLGTG
jgi:hypothetical protein